VVVGGILQVEGDQRRAVKFLEVVARPEVYERCQSTVACSQRKRRPGMKLFQALWPAAQARGQWCR
jgi:hypothetical protein